MSLSLSGSIESAQSDRKDPPKAWKLGVVIASFWFVFVAVYLFFWEEHPDLQVVLNRISWSSADAVAIAATALALYSYYMFEKSTQSKDMQYLQKFILAFKQAGIEPEMLAPVLTSLTASYHMVVDDSEFAGRLKRVSARMAKERIERLKGLTEEELYELLRSGGLR